MGPEGGKPGEEAGLDRDMWRKAFLDSLKVKLLQETDTDGPLKMWKQRQRQGALLLLLGPIACSSVPSLGGAARSSVPRPKRHGCWEQGWRQWGPDLWPQTQA